MQFSYQTVELSSIDHADASFRISTSDASAALINSISTIGLQSPPTLFDKSDHYVIVSGYARVQACKKIGLKKIDARIVPPSITVETCIRHAIAENVFQRDLNLVEQARAVNMLLDISPETEALVSTAHFLGMTINQKMVNKLVSVNQMPEQLQQGLISGAIALPVALHLNALTEQQNREDITQLFIELNLSLNRQRALLEWMEAIAKRDQISISQLINDASLQKIRHDPELDRRQKVNQIWQYFKMMRSPEIASFEENYRRILKKLQLKKGVRLHAPPNFEGTTYSLEVEFKNLDEMKEMEQEISRLIRSPHMNSILDPFKK